MKLKNNKLINLAKKNKINLKDMKIASKLMIYFLTVLILTCTISGVGVFGLNKAKNTANEIHKQHDVNSSHVRYFDKFIRCPI
jgi:hypothetical protein